MTKFIIGGPTTLLPRSIESFLSWSLCFSCLSVSGYHYCVSTYLKPLVSKLRWALSSSILARVGFVNHVSANNGANNDGGGGGKHVSGSEDNSLTSLPLERSDDLNDPRDYAAFVSCWVPLTTHSRAELDRRTPLQRYEQLLQVLLCILPSIVRETQHAHSVPGAKGDGGSHHETSSPSPFNEEDTRTLHEMLRSPKWEKVFIELFRTHDICRRLASLVMRPHHHHHHRHHHSSSYSSSHSTTTMLILEQPSPRLLVRKLATWWPQLLTLPSIVVPLEQCPQEPCLQDEDSSLSSHDDLPSSSSPTDTSPRSTGSHQSSSYSFDITLIIPAYRETGTHLSNKINHALEACTCPKAIEIVVVDAGESQELQETVDRLAKNNALLKQQHEDLVQHDFQQDVEEEVGEEYPTSPSSSSSFSTKSSLDHPGKEGKSIGIPNESIVWGDIRLLVFDQGGGRGPCLNFGAVHARGKILTFCHLDTALPSAWDEKICVALGFNQMKRSVASNCQRTSTTQAATNVTPLSSPSSTLRRVNSCAFSFGIDTSAEGLSNGFVGTISNYYPPGIKAVEMTANIRTHLYSLPYGDQVISIPKSIFEFLGGFPGM